MNMATFVKVDKQKAPSNKTKSNSNISDKYFQFKDQFRQMTNCLKINMQTYQDKSYH